MDQSDKFKTRERGEGEREKDMHKMIKQAKTGS